MAPEHDQQDFVQEMHPGQPEYNYDFDWTGQLYQSPDAFYHYVNLWAELLLKNIRQVTYSGC